MTVAAIRGSTRCVRLAAAASLAMAVAAGTAACGSAAPLAPTARVERGQVSTKVSASGALAAVSSQNLGFANAAQLVELDAAEEVVAEAVTQIAGPIRLTAALQSIKLPRFTGGSRDIEYPIRLKYHHDEGATWISC